MSQTHLHIYCSFNGLSASLPFGTPENYRKASELAIRLVGLSGRAISNSEETFFLETIEQLEALGDLQRLLKVKRPDDEP